jgi:hypothetical protein
MYSVRLLPDSLYTPEIIEKCKAMFVNPTYTKKEADVIAASFKPPFSVSDTLGYAALKHKRDSLRTYYRSGYYAELHGEEEDLYYTKRNRIKEAGEMGLTLEQYCDSMNMDYYQRVADTYVGKTLYGLGYVLSSFAENKVYFMAPLIEEYGKQYFSDIEIQEMLARLDYKDYKERHDTYNAQQIINYTQQIDSLSKILSSIDEIILPSSYSKGHREYIELRWIMDDLKHLGTQDAYFAMAPLLLIKNRVKTYHPQYEFLIGIDFYEKIARLFIGVPLPKCVDPEWIGIIHQYDDGACKAIEDYLPKVYQWMLDNKGKYELKN